MCDYLVLVDPMPLGFETDYGVHEVALRMLLLYEIVSSFGLDSLQAIYSIVA